MPPGPSGLAAADTLGRRSVLIFALKFNATIDPNIPNATGPFTRVRLEPRATGTLQVVNGAGGVVTCNNALLQGGIQDQTCQIFDAADLNPAVRLVPEPRGPISSATLSIGGDVPLTKKMQVVNVDAYRPGNAFVHASTALTASLHTIAIEVRAPRLARWFPQAPPGKLLRARAVLSNERRSRGTDPVRGWD